MNAQDTRLIEKLRAGETVKFKCCGGSMVPRINPGELKTVEPIVDHDVLKKDDMVYCTVHGNTFTHIIKAIKGSGLQKEWLIGNNHGRINGWTNKKHIYGICTKVEKS